MKFRRLIYISFLAAFAAAAFFLLPYSMGYRYDFKKNQLVRTGSLVIDSVPQNALIYLEKKSQPIDFTQFARSLKKWLVSGNLEEKTPVIFNLAPNEYSLEVIKDGYYPWKKQLTVQSRQTTFADRILLFSRQPKIDALVQEDIRAAYPSPDSPKIAYLIFSEIGERISLLDIESEKSIPLHAASFPVADIRWSPSSKKLLVAEDNDGRTYYSVIGIEKPDETIALDSFRFAGAKSDKMSDLKDARWDSENDTLLYAASQNAVYRIDLLNRDVRPLVEFSAGVVDYLVGKDALYYLENIAGKNGTCLKRQDISGLPAADDCDYIFPLAADYRFISQPDAPKGMIAVKDEKKGILFLVDMNASGGGQDPLLKADAKDFQWSADGKKLLYYNDFELWVFYPEDDKKELLSRYSSPIVKAVWYPGKDYVIFAFNDSVQAIEEDGRDKRNAAELAKIDGAESLMMPASQPLLYLNGKIGGQMGLYKIKIQ